MIRLRMVSPALGIGFLPEPRGRRAAPCRHSEKRRSRRIARTRSLNRCMAGRSSCSTPYTSSRFSLQYTWTRTFLNPARSERLIGEVFRDKSLIAEDCKTLPVGFRSASAPGRDQMVGDIDRCLDTDEKRMQHHIPLVPVGLQLCERDGSVPLPVSGGLIEFPQMTGDPVGTASYQAFVSRILSNHSSVSL